MPDCTNLPRVFCSLLFTALALTLAGPVAGQAPTRTTFEQSTDVSTPGEPVTLSAMVDASDQLTPTGEVVFRDVDEEVGRANLEAIGPFATAAGAGFNNCALSLTGFVSCWSDGRQTPAEVFGIEDIVDLSVGDFHRCAVARSGTVHCWGLNENGQLGDGTTTNRNQPVQVLGITDAVLVAAGYNHSCAIVSDGSIRCWGRGRYGQLGHGVMASSWVPVPVNGIQDAIAISVGGASSHDTSCAVLANGQIRCWGSGGYGQLGDGSRSNTATPVPVEGIANATSIAVGWAHVCATLATGRIACWGLNHRGQLGNGEINQGGTTVLVSDIESAVQVSAGFLHSCAILRSGSARCWGTGEDGRLGQGSDEDPIVPVTVSGLSDAILISAGWDRSCAVQSSGSIQCWGRSQAAGGGASFVPVAVRGWGQNRQSHAVLTTQDMLPGQRRLTAHFLGNDILAPSTSRMLTHYVDRAPVAFIGGGAIFAMTDACAPVLGDKPHPVTLRYTAAELSGVPSGVSIFWPDGAEHLALWGPMAQSTQFLGGAGRAVWSRFVFYPTRPLIRVVNRQVHSPEGARLVQAQELTLRLRVQNFAATPGCSVTLSATLHRDAS